MNAPYECRDVQPRLLSRRSLLQSVAAGFGWMALGGLATSAAARAAGNTPASAGQGGASGAPLGRRAPHFQPTARRVIFLCMQGGPSQLDLFDPKPRL